MLKDSFPKSSQTFDIKYFQFRKVILFSKSLFVFSL